MYDSGYNDGAWNGYRMAISDLYPLINQKEDDEVDGKIQDMWGW